MLPHRFFPIFVWTLGIVLGIGLGDGVDRVAAQDRGTPLFGPMLSTDTVMAGPFDTGRLWSLARMPDERLQTRYEVDVTEEWRRHARSGMVRLPNCSGVLVSPDGLVLTAAGCVREHLLGEDVPDSLLVETVHASTPGREQKVPGLFVDRVNKIADVTASVRATRDSLQEQAASGASRFLLPRAQEQVEQQRQRGAREGERVDVVAEGTGYTAYTYRRHEDVRLAFLPDPRISRFGGVENQWAYPRHRWNAVVLRLYEEGRPLDTPDHLSLRNQGPRPSDPAFVLGFPEPAHRVETSAQVAHRRDAVLPAEQSVLETWGDAVQAYVESNGAPFQWEMRLADGQGDRWRRELVREGLRSTYVQRRLRAKDAALVANTTDGRALVDSLNGLQEEKQERTDAARAFVLFEHPRYSSATLRRAWTAVQAPSDSLEPEALADRLRQVASQPQSVDAALLAARIRRAATIFEGDSLRQQAATLTDSSVAARMSASVLRSPEKTAAALQAGQLPREDPLGFFLQPLLDAYRAFQEDRAQIRDQEHRWMRRLARLRAEATALPVVQPRERSLRISDGAVKGYPSNGTHAPALTTFYGLYGRQWGAAKETWTLPAAWKGPPEALAPSTPLMTVSTPDVGGGMRGGALVNSALQVVGLVTGGNDRSLTGSYTYIPNRMRAVSLDVRGLLEGLRTVYGAERLADEMTGRAESGSSSSSDVSN